MTTPHNSINLNTWFRPLLLSTIFSCLTIVTGIAPNLTAQQPSQIFSNVAQADDFNDEELRNYAAALMQIEPIRQSTLAQVTQVNGGRLPNLVCNQPETMGGLNHEAKSLFVKYCNDCERIAASRGINIDKFNQITQSLYSNPSLKERVLKFMQ